MMSAIVRKTFFSNPAPKSRLSQDFLMGGKNAKYLPCRDAQRTEKLDSPDDFPTPPWATRAPMEHVIERPGYSIREKTARN